MREVLHINDVLSVGQRASVMRALGDMRDAPRDRAERKSKYANKKVRVGSMSFDSKAEHRRWLYLIQLFKAGEIFALQRQVKFEVIPSSKKPSGGRERAAHYIADFTYFTKDERYVIEDVKGALTRDYLLKRKLMLWRYGIEVQEVRA